LKKNYEERKRKYYKGMMIKTKKKGEYKKNKMVINKPSMK
jgi:hypothetical protein